MPAVLHLHLDPFSGLAGDMFLGACLDLGVPREVLDDAVAGLGLDGVELAVGRERRGGLDGVRFRVLVDGRDAEDADGPGHGRSLADLRRLLAASALAAEVRELAEELFVRLGEAEAKVHGVELDDVHFHEVGAVDSLVDLVGAAAAVRHLAAERITCGAPVPLGSGTVETAHGRLPVPAPATAELLHGAPVEGGGDGELVTPTGAVLLAVLVDGYGALPALTVEAVGYGVGRRDTPGRPNAFRLWRGRSAGEAAGEGRVTVVECQVDDASGEALGHVAERLLEEGALDAWLAAVTMKKGRPGVVVRFLCRQPDLERLSELLLRETGSLGCRFWEAGRVEAERRWERVETPFGTVRVKLGRLAGRSLGAAPEYEECRRRAREAGVPWREVYRAALVAAAGAGEEG